MYKSPDGMLLRDVGRWLLLAGYVIYRAVRVEPRSLRWCRQPRSAARRRLAPREAR